MLHHWIINAYCRVRSLWTQCYLPDTRRSGGFCGSDTRLLPDQPPSDANVERRIGIWFCV
eukprot:351228-Chlamydomonas_euryale.AAC.4